MTTESDIEQFCSHFEVQLEAIVSLDISPDKLAEIGLAVANVRLYRKSLLIVGMDSLAAIRFPRKTYPSLNRSNRERFTRFLGEFGDWKEGDLISLPFLLDRLELIGRSASPLAGYVRECVQQYDSSDGGTVPISSMDKYSEELMRLAQTEKEEDAISEDKHYALLYRYRNYLVHESREPGGAMEFDSLSAEPYYHGYVNSDKWHLAFPMSLFVELYRNCISAFRGYLIESTINPYDFVSDTTRW